MKFDAYCDNAPCEAIYSKTTYQAYPSIPSIWWFRWSSALGLTHIMGSESPQLVTFPVVDSKGTLRLGMAISHVLFCFWEWCCGNFYLLRKQIFMKVHYCNSRRVKSSCSSVTMMTIFICCESVYLLHRGGYNTPRRGLSPDVVRLADHQWYVTMIRHHKFHRMTRRCVWR